jgi:class 3 adenylate cyclase
MECGSALTTATVSSEKKQITVLFADVAGSMDLQEHLDAEVWAGIMGRFVAVLAEGVRKYGGTVDKFTGDGIMALFGAPVAQEDHARRACHAALDLVKAIGEFSTELRRQGLELHVRLGLNSGEVVVGPVGDDARLDPTALGHTVGLAQRMEAMAEPGRAYLTQHTARLVEGWFDLKELGPMAVKGSRVPVPVYVLGPALAPARRRTLGASPLVGRERELEILEEALMLATEGHAQVVGVVGEAGVGKSRLCDEFALRAAERAIVRRTAGLSHARDVPLLPILDLLRDYFAITDADDAPGARRRITERVLSLDPALEETLPLLFDVLEVPDPARPPPQLAPDVRQRRIFDALRRLTQRRSERSVLVLVLEDLHWFDPQSEAFLERLIESVPGSRTLVVANFRPEFTAAWTCHSYYRQLPMAPLPGTAVTQLLDGLVGGHSSVRPLLSFVLERTAGNPFFVEEVVRALVQDGVLVGQPGAYRLKRPLDDVKIPPSVQAVVAARIDHLPGVAKAALQTAAVIGRQFSAALLGAVGGTTPEESDDVLTRLCAAELVLMVEGDEYRFWHPLTQEVAYSTLLGGKRAALHGAVAHALAAEAERRRELEPLIAYHFECAAEPVEAARWQERAATRLWSRTIDDALDRWRAALALLATAPPDEESARIALRIHIQLVRVGARVGLPASEYEQHYAEARRLADSLGDESAAAHADYAYGLVPCFTRGEFTGPIESTSRAKRFAEQVGNYGLLTSALQFLAILRSFVGPVTDGLLHAEQLIALTGGDPEAFAGHDGFSPLLRGILYRGELLVLGGRLEDGRRDGEAAMKLARERSEGEADLMSGWVLAHQLEFTGEPVESSARAREAVRFAEDSGNIIGLLVALEALGVTERLTGELQAGDGTLRRALNVATETGVGLFVRAGVLAQMARVQWKLGCAEAAEAAANEAVELAFSQRAQILECRARLTRGSIWRAAGREADATAELHAALALANGTGALTYEPFVREELARLHPDSHALADALRLYRGIGATGHARRLESELGAEV